MDLDFALTSPKFPQYPKIRFYALYLCKEFNIIFIALFLDFWNQMSPGELETPFFIGQKLEFPGLMQFFDPFFFTFFLHFICIIFFFPTCLRKINKRKIKNYVSTQKNVFRSNSF